MTSKNSKFKIQNSKWGVLILALLAGACGSDHSDRTTLRQREDAMMADPMGYQSPHVDTDITGGDTSHFDKKSFNRDMDHVLNP